MKAFSLITKNLNTYSTRAFVSLYLLITSTLVSADDLDDLNDKTESAIDDLVDMLAGWGTGIFTIAFMVCGVMFLKGRWPREYMINCAIGAGIFAAGGLLSNVFFAFMA